MIVDPGVHRHDRDTVVAQVAKRRPEQRPGDAVAMGASLDRQALDEAGCVSGLPAADTGDDEPERTGESADGTGPVARRRPTDGTQPAAVTAPHRPERIEVDRRRPAVFDRPQGADPMSVGPMTVDRHQVRGLAAIDRGGWEVERVRWMVVVE